MPAVDRAVDVVVEVVDARGARLVAVTGGVAAGKSTFAAALADALPRRAVVVSTDGFLLADHPARGMPESYDAVALGAFLDAARAGDPAAWAPVYSHRTYAIVPGERAVVGDAEVVVVDGLHLAHPMLGGRERFDVVVHLDADDADLERWYLERFRALRTAAETDPTAMLHAYVHLGPDALDAMALDVWRDLNLVVLRDHVRPAAAGADVVLWFDADHALERVDVREG